MATKFKEKFNDFSNLIVSVALDVLGVFCLALLTRILKYLLEEWVYRQKLEQIDNKAVLIVYHISEVFIVTLYALFVLYDIISLIVEFIKKLKEQNKKK